MKICFFSSEISVHTRRWLNLFIKNGHEMHLITFSPAVIGGVEVHSLDARTLFGFLPRFLDPLPTILNLRFIPKIKKILKEINPDVFHGHYLTCYAFFAACSGFQPLITSAWGSDVALEPERSPLFNFFVKYTIKKSKIVHVCDEASAKRLLELGCPSEKIFIQPWGIDILKFSPERRSMTLRKTWQIDRGQAVINTCGLKKLYHVDVFIKAIPKVLKEIPDVKFIIASGGPMEAELKALAESLGVSRNTIFLGGLPYEKMPELFASSDVYVDTYFPDTGKAGGGIGLATMEAMASAIPQIMPKTPSIASSADWFCGISYQPGNFNELADQIIKVLKSTKLSVEMAERSRQVAIKIFDLEKNVNDWNNLYLNIKRKTS